MEQILASVKAHFKASFTASGLRILIIAWAIFIIVLALSTKDEWLLAGILAYEILP